MHITDLFIVNVAELEYTKKKDNFTINVAVLECMN